MNKRSILPTLLLAGFVLPAAAVTLEQIEQADAYVQQRDYRKAKYIYFSAIDKGVYSQRAHMGLATVFAEQGRLTEALDWVTKVLAVDAGHREALFLRSQIYSRLGQYNDALDDLNRLIANDENNPQLWRALDSVYSLMGDTENAERAKARHQALTGTTE